jgi:glycerophosphoryl diester phosphodiesterase
MQSAAFKFIAQERPIAIAHRGGASRFPENSMAAFGHAVALGYDFIETDVQVTRDGVALAFHDPDLDRVTDRTGAIAELDWTEVKGAKLANGEAPARLADLLAAWPGAAFNLDPKSDRAVVPMLAAIRHTEAWSRVCVGSFSSPRLSRVRELAERPLCTSMGQREVARLRFASFGMPVGRFAANLAQVPLRFGAFKIVDRFFVTAAHRRGLKVHVWTINQRQQMEDLLDLGVDGIMTDDTELLKQVFTERGLWR